MTTNFVWRDRVEQHADEVANLRQKLKLDSTNPEVPRLLAIARTHLETAELFMRKAAENMS